MFQSNLVPHSVRQRW